MLTTPQQIQLNQLQTGRRSPDTCLSDSIQLVCLASLLRCQWCTIAALLKSSVRRVVAGGARVQGSVCSQRKCVGAGIVWEGTALGG